MKKGKTAIMSDAGLGGVDSEVLEDSLKGALQENVLAMLIFDDKASKMIRRLIEPKLFESAVYKKIAERAITYIDEFDAPAGEHLPDLMEDILTGSDTRKASVYERTLNALFQAYGGMNRDYVISRLAEFVRGQRLKIGLVNAFKATKESKIDLAVKVLHEAISSKTDVFDPGVRMWITKEALSFFDTELNNSVPLGIPALDAVGIGPAPKELFTIIAPTGRGKSWFLGHVAKQAIKFRKKAVFISLEMSTDRLCQRFIQTYFWYQKRGGNKVMEPILRRDRKTKELSRIRRKEASRPGIDEKGAKRELMRQHRRIRNRMQLIFKQFQPSTMTVQDIAAYLDSLERSENFIPDVILIDYADLLHHDQARLRTELELTYQQLRALAIDRSCAVVTASQSNRTGGEAKVVQLEHVAEALGKANISDNVLTYNQTASEKRHGLARLFVAKGRNDLSGFSVVITQAYAIGQFCLDSAVQPGQSYWDMIQEKSYKEDDEDGLDG